MSLPNGLHRRWDKISQVECERLQLFLLTVTDPACMLMLITMQSGHKYFTDDREDLKEAPNLRLVLGVAGDNREMTPSQLRQHIQHIFQIPVWNHTLSNGLCPESPHHGEELQIDGNTWVCIAADRRHSKLTVTLSLVPLKAVEEN